MNTHRNLRWNAAGVPEEIRHAFDRFFQQEESDPSNVVTSQWAPRVDIKEEDKRFVIFVDVPGVDPAEIEVSMEKGILTIKGERAHGTFHRRFALPDSANPDEVTAVGRHGVLEIVIPKRAETTPRRVTISTEHGTGSSGTGGGNQSTSH